MFRNRRVHVAITVVLIVLLAIPVQFVLAWKPYTHNYTGSKVLEDVVSDGQVTINGRPYTVRPAIVQALRDWPQFYNAGVVGPDGFPDLVYGQSIIHPGDTGPGTEDTGKWLRHIFNYAWQAQSDPRYSAAEKSQILAFTYGYLTHAAGDMWGHTLVNDFAQGVFPAVSDILTNVDDAEIALRHIIVEGYVGDATPGFDGNPERGPAPGGDVSDDSTPGIAYDAPHRFVYETLIRPDAPTPTADRGAIIGFFLNLRAGLAAEVSSDPDPVQSALDHFKNIKAAFDALGAPARCTGAADNDGDGKVNDGCPSVAGGAIFDWSEEGNECDNAADDDDDGAVNDGCPKVGGSDEGNSGACSFGAGLLGPGNIGFDVGHDIVACPAALLVLGFDVAIGSAAAFFDFVVGTLNALLNELLDAYLAAWIDDIDDGLRHWNELGLASTRALFDPQVRRDLQNKECQFQGPEDSLLRAQCEDAIGITDVLLDQADPFINDHLLSMLGAPDFVGGLREALQELSEALDNILGPISVVFNPIRMTLAEIKEFAKDKVKELIKERYGIDIDALKDFLTSPTHWINVESAQVTLPVLGTVTIEFFHTSDHERLDAIMGLPADHHVPSDLPFPGASTRLSDAAVVDPATFAPLKNTITTGKLLLLDGSELNRLLGDTLAGQGLIRDASIVQTYQDGAAVPANIMIDSLPMSACPAISVQRGARTGGLGDLDIGSLDAHIVYMPLIGQNTNDGVAFEPTFVDCGPWLRSIDSDHAWRVDGLPVFHNNIAAQLPYRRVEPPAIYRPVELNGGNGNFPIWESCLLRPVFPQLYTDWENGTQQFPDLGDWASPDPADPNPPVSSLAVSGAVFTSGGTTYIGANHVFTLSATDSVFAAGALGLQYRFYKDGTMPSEDQWQSLPNGATFSIPAGAGDGIWHVDYRAGDPCHTFAVEGGGAVDPLPPEATATATYVLDTTPPAIQCGAPDGLWHATDVSIACTASDISAGLANPADANFLLWTHVPPGTQTANAETDTRTVCDALGNCAIAGPIGGNKVDKKAPVITIVQPAPTSYAHSAVLTLDYTVDDDGGSGVNHFTPLLDGAGTLAGHGLASGQAINLLTELALGSHTFTIDAVDNVGNASTASVTFTLIVTADSIKDDVNRFHAAGAIKNQGLANSLLAKLNAAAKARARGQCKTAANIYQAFINELQAQSGKGVDATAAAIMIADAQYLIAHCP